jgi:hypothetical protein
VDWESPGSTRRMAGSSSGSPPLFRPVRHHDQHTTRLNDAHSESIRITSPAHPLYGETVPVVRRLTQYGEPFVVIRLPAGSSQLIPARWTTDAAADAGGLLALPFTASSLRALVRMVAQLRNRAHPEAADDAEACRRSVGELQPPDPTSPGLALDRPAPPPSPGSAGALDRRLG